MVTSNNINELIQKFMEGKHGELSNGDIMIRRKAGIWQGIDSYQDMDMLILRDVNFEMSIPQDIHSLIDITLPDLPWSEQHFQERVSGIPMNPGESYLNWPYA